MPANCFTTNNNYFHESSKIIARGKVKHTPLSRDVVRWPGGGREKKGEKSILKACLCQAERMNAEACFHIK